MKKLASAFALAMLICSSLAFADSSGNFTAAGTTQACTATPATFTNFTCSNNAQCPASAPTCTGGICQGGACATDANCGAGAVCDLALNGGTCVGAGTFTGATLSNSTSLTSFTTNIQTPNGQGTTLDITAAMVTGLFTSTKLTTTINNATADVGILVCVYVDPTTISGPPGNQTFSGGLPVFPRQCVVFDQRIQQVSNTLFGQAATCIPPPPTATVCTTDAGCPAGDSCVTGAACIVPAPGSPSTCPGGATASCVSGSGTPGSAGTCTTGLCQAPAAGCNFEILLTTLGAHTFDWVVRMPGNGSHLVAMTWALIGQNQNTTNGSTAACVGPVKFGVMQVKNFKNDSTITFNTN